LFHDLGKSKTHAIEHGKLGAEMGKAPGLPAAITDIMEKPIRGGLTEAEATDHEPESLQIDVRGGAFRRLQ
jgi:uncharacterized protein